MQNIYLPLAQNRYFNLLCITNFYCILIKIYVFLQGPEPALNSSPGGAAKPPPLNAFELDRCLDR